LKKLNKKEFLETKEMQQNTVRNVTIVGISVVFSLTF